MILLVQLKDDLLTVFRNYEIKEHALSEEYKKMRLEFDHAIKTYTRVTSLWEFSLFRANKMEGLFLGMFRNDLKRALLKVLKQSKYNENALLKDDLRTADSEQKDQNKIKEALQQGLDISNPDDSKLVQIYNELSKLSAEVKHCQQQIESYQQTIQTLEVEKKALEEKLGVVEQSNKELQAQLRLRDEQLITMQNKLSENNHRYASILDRCQQLEAKLSGYEQRYGKLEDNQDEMEQAHSLDGATTFGNSYRHIMRYKRQFNDFPGDPNNNNEQSTSDGSIYRNNRTQAYKPTY